MGCILGEARGQDGLLQALLEELVSEDYLVRMIKAYAVRLDLQILGFGKAQPQKTGRPPYALQALFLRLLSAPCLACFAYIVQRPARVSAMWA